MIVAKSLQSVVSGQTEIHKTGMNIKISLRNDLKVDMRFML